MMWRLRFWTNWLLCSPYDAAGVGGAWEADCPVHGDVGATLSPVLPRPQATDAEKDCVWNSIDFCWKAIETDSRGEFKEALKVVLHFAGDQLASNVSREPISAERWLRERYSAVRTIVKMLTQCPEIQGKEACPHNCLRRLAEILEAYAHSLTTPRDEVTREEK